MNSRQFENTQKGFVSIIVCMIIMTILSLITIGFAQVMSREQRQALDRQLSSQAFYAAESGVNDALLNVDSLSSNDCTGTASDIAPGSVGGVRISCVTGSDVVSDIRTDTPADPSSPRIYPIRTATRLTTLQIRWSPTSTTGGALFRPAGTQTLPAIDNWGVDTGALKLFILMYRTNASGRQDLINDMGHVVLMPVTSGSATPATVSFTNLSGTNKGLVASANCNAGVCALDITGLPNYDDMAVAVTSLYRSNSVIIDGTDSAGVSQSFRDAQVIVDSTGRTSDVVRRIQVRRAIESQVRTSTAAILTDGVGGLCKRMLAGPNYPSPTTGLPVLGSSNIETCL